MSVAISANQRQSRASQREPHIRSAPPAHLLDVVAPAIASRTPRQEPCKLPPTSHKLTTIYGSWVTVHDPRFTGHSFTSFTSYLPGPCFLGPLFPAGAPCGYAAGVAWPLGPCYLYTGTDCEPRMDHLWTPWRFAYITSADNAVRAGVPKALDAWPGDLGCVFCNLIAAIDYAIEQGMARDQAEAAGGLVLRGQHCYICLNAFPYTSGHVMVVPYAHLRPVGRAAPRYRTRAHRSGAAHRTGSRSRLHASRLQLWYEYRPGRGRGRRWSPASARHAALGRRHQLHDHRRRNPRPA